MSITTKHHIKRLILLAVFIALFTDFGFFAHRAAGFSQKPQDFSHADAVVVLTGGQSRIAAAVALADEQDIPVFISGVHPGSPSDDVAQANGVDADFFACCVTLGYRAANTAQNGREIANWAREQGFDEFVVVTSNYHMERAILELRRAMPEAAFVPNAVESPAIDARNWWKDARSARRMVLEWAKWRVVSIRESFAGR